MPQKSVLIVEDDAIIAVHLRNILTGLGYRVSGTEATGEMAIATAVATPPDLILMDIELAGQIDGITAAGSILAAYDVPVIFLTSYSQDILLQRAKSTGPYGYLIKPVSQRELAVTIEMVLYRHTVDKQLKEQKEELRKGKAFNLAILNSVAASIAVLNLDGEIIAVNEPWQRFTLANGSASGKPVLHTEVGSNYLAICRECSSSTIEDDAVDATKACAGIKSVLAGGSTCFTLEYPCHSPEEKRWFSMGVTPLGRDKAGVVVAHTNITERKMAEESLRKAHDELELRVFERTAELVSANARLGLEITERQQARVALQESRERYRRITEGLTDYFYTVWLKDGEIVETTHSLACETVTGYSPEEYAANPSLWMQMVVAEDRELVTDNIQKILVGGNVPSIDHRIIHKDGHIYWVSTKFIQQIDSSGKLVAYDGVVTNITERVESQERLYKSNATLNMAIDGISDPLFLLDAKLRIKRMNRAAKDYYGLAGYREAIGKFCFEALRGRSSPCAGCETPFSDMYGYSGSFERRGLLNHDHIEEVVVDVVRDAAGSPKAAIFRIFDITKQKMVDRQLIQNEKLASLGLLIAGVAHEINNPNNFIYFNIPILRSYLQFLLPIADEYASANPDLLVFNRPYAPFREDCLKLLENIEHGSTRINQIVSNLREFARDRGKGERRRIDLKLVVEKGISICIGRIKKLVKTLDVHIPEGLPALVSDPLAIEQIVVNLMINAAQAADKDESWIRLTISERSGPTGKVVVEVSDNGCGMDSETLKKIFDPFYTTKAAGVGTGLGLAISHRLMTELGGSIEVESEVGTGSTFHLVLAATNDE